MSTKIYNGFLLKPDTNIFLLKKDFQEKYSRKLQQRTRQAFIEEMIIIFDRYQTKNFIYTIDDKPLDYSTPETAFAGLRFDISSTLMHISRLINNSEPWEASTGKQVPSSVREFYSEQQGSFTIGQHANGTLLGLMHAQEDYREVIESLDSFQEWLPYWNNSDRPDDVTKKQWTARKKLWEETFNLGLPAKSTGILIQGSEWYDSYMDLSWKNFTEDDWDEEKITRSRAKEICLNEWVDSRVSDADFEEKIPKIMRAIREYTQEDHTERLAQITEKLVPLTFETVVGKSPKKS